jgi:DsbC/DsbD-like thiol-disulfide interchange protein
MRGYNDFMRGRWEYSVSLAILLLMAGVLSAAEQHARAELIANTSAIQPGKPFWVGVRLTMTPGWHVYWKNPGDAGVATKVTFDLPPGFTAGPVQYPTPLKFPQPGDITIYGYEGSVLLMAQITPPEDLAAGTNTAISADVKWMVCSDVCQLGKANVNLSLPISASPESANATEFDKFRAELPVDAADCPDVLDVKISGSVQSQFTVEADWKHSAGKNVDFFPGSLDSYDITGIKVQPLVDSTHITFTAKPMAGQSPAPVNLEAVIGYDDDQGDRRGIRINISLPESRSPKE